jgi:hypothetical protein
LAAQVVASFRLAQGSVTTCTQLPEAPHVQGGQVVPAGQDGQAQAPMPYQSQLLVLSEVQPAASAWAVHGSAGAEPASQEQGAQAAPAGHAGQVQLRVPSELAVPVPEEPLTTVPFAEQPQSQGAQAALSGQTGQAQAQVPWSTQPPFTGPAEQSQAQGGQVSPAAQGAQAQVQLPPVVAPPPPAQSHSMGGQAASLGQETGLTQAQLPLPLAMAWQ